MAAYSANCDAVLDALAVEDIDHAGMLVTEGASHNLQKAAQVVILNGQCEVLKFLIREHKLDVDKYYCLHLALLVRQEDIAKWLADSGADVNKHWKVESRKDIDIPTQKCDEILGKKYYGRCLILCPYPLGLSVQCSVEMMRFPLQSGADMSRDSPMRMCGESVLHMAIKTGNVEKIKLLIDHEADIEVRTCYYETPLIYACAHPTVSSHCVQVLLEKGANHNWRTGGFLVVFWWFSGGFLVAVTHIAVESGNTQKLKLLIHYGAQLEARTSDGNTALILACKVPVPDDCVRILLENGAFPNVKNRHQQMPLTLATGGNYGKKDKIRLLKQYGAVEEEKTDQEETALMSACQRNGDVETVRHLLENNASPNLRNRGGETALHYAILADDIQKLQVLIQYNSDVNSMDDNGVTSLMRAREELLVSVECVRFLLENNALPSLTDIRGETAVHYAARTRNRPKLELLVQHGADVNAADVDGRTPLMRACAEDAVDVDNLRFLLDNIDLQASLIEQNRTGILSFMDDFYSQSKSLFQLCCVTISYTVGGVPRRLDRINSLPLPELLKKQLLFKNSYIPEGCITDSSTTEDSDQDSFIENI